ncbi:hypothetical protein ITJ38_12415 [Agreia pratensis]|uniref:hypothetical protein n=1 Tax=Agreia pratensis TaxID=150121 RepID=UPI00188A2824|nr:hypothetical protein [Agreia pratensis]MBF4635212.1 hypothetical protein [Agreia pratensis]
MSPFGWISYDTARARFETTREFFCVMNGEAGDGTVVPDFVLHVGPGVDGPSIRAQFFTPGGAVYRTIDYKSVDGRLFKWIVRERSYPNMTSRYTLSQATTVVEGTFEPDGHASVKFNDKSQPTVQLRELNDVPVASHWMPIPAFGDWDSLTDPHLGVLAYELFIRPDA